ncbi:unnamed protein product [Camellia sinensis]
MSNLNVSNGLQNCKPSHHLSFEWNHCLGPTDGTLVATGGGDDKGFLWKIGHKKSVSSFAFNTDGQLFSSGSFDGLAQMGDINSGNLKCTLDGHNGGIEWIRWHPKGHLVLAGSEDSIVWMWNADKSAYLNIKLWCHSYHTEGLTCLTITSDSTLALTGSKDIPVHIVNITTGKG